MPFHRTLWFIRGKIWIEELPRGIYHKPDIMLPPVDILRVSTGPEDLDPDAIDHQVSPLLVYLLNYLVCLVPV